MNFFRWEVRFFESDVSYWCMTNINDIEQLFRTHYAAMHRMAMLILRDEDVARDIVHDVFAHLLSQRCKAPDGDVFESLLTAGTTDVSAQYLLRAVRNRCLNYLRNLSTRERIREIYALDEQEIADEEWPDDETIARIHSTITCNLTPACSRVVELRFTEGMSYKEIAAALGVSETAVYKHLRHAIDVLRQKLSQNG